MNGSYKTTRDGGIEYTYEAECGMQGRDWHWAAKVRRADGQLCGTPRGVIFEAPSFVEDPVLRHMVEGAIENKVGVD